MFTFFNKKSRNTNLGEQAHLKMKLDELIGSFEHDLRYSPDAWRLEIRKRQNVFVPCNMQTGHPAHGYVAEEFRIASAAFTARRFMMFKLKKGELTNPIPLQLAKDQEPPFSGVPGTYVKGELWSVRSERIPELDTYHQNGTHFTRHLVPIVVPCTECKHFIGTNARVEVTRSSRMYKAWMYVAEDSKGSVEFWNKVLDGGYQTGLVRTFPSDRMKNRDGTPAKVYHFTTKEYEDA
jgi:gamma-glutamyl AIG2-like cyclotransferase